MSSSSNNPTNSKGKAKLTEQEMKYRYQKVRISDSYAKSDLDIRESELGHIDMEDFWARTNQATNGPWMNKLIRSGLHFLARLPVSAINNEFIMLVDRCYNKDTRCVKDKEGKTVIDLTSCRFEITLGIPHHRKYIAISLKDYKKAWHDYEDKCMQMMNELYLKNKNAVSRWPQTIHRSDFNEELSDTITFLSRVYGLPDAHHFHKWMLRYLETMSKNVP